MSGLVPFNRNIRNDLSTGSSSPWNNIANMLDTFFGNDSVFMKDFNQGFKIDVKNGEKEYTVQADLPGVKKEEVNVAFHDGTLTISINKEENKDTRDEKEHYIHRERSYSSMSRSMYLDNINADEIKAKLDEGVLTVTLPKSEAAKNKKDIAID